VGPLRQQYRGERKGKPWACCQLAGLGPRKRDRGEEESACTAGLVARWGGDRAGQIEKEEESGPWAKGQAEHWAAMPKREGVKSFSFLFFSKSILNFDFESYLLSFETFARPKQIAKYLIVDQELLLCRYNS
jgi:hypothetical protein